MLNLTLNNTLKDSSNRSSGLPAHQVAVINSNGYYDGVTQHDFWLVDPTVTVGGGAILTRTTPDTTIVDISGIVNFVSDWSDSWQVTSFGPYDWENLLTGNTKK